MKKKMKIALLLLFYQLVPSSEEGFMRMLPACKGILSFFCCFPCTSWSSLGKWGVCEGFIRQKYHHQKKYIYMLTNIN